MTRSTSALHGRYLDREVNPKDLQRLAARLAARAPQTIGEAVVRRAAVAAILRPDEDALSLLLIRRAEREGDRWSGHMAFPGGLHESYDRDLLATAIRETREEIGLDLEAHAELLGRLDDVQAGGSRRPSGIIATPYVFALRETPPLEPNHEVAEIVWTPIAPLLAGETACTYDYPWQDVVMRLPGHKVGERVVWGMTYRMIEALFDEMRALVQASME